MTIEYLTKHSQIEPGKWIFIIGESPYFNIDIFKIETKIREYQKQPRFLYNVINITNSHQILRINEKGWSPKSLAFTEPSDYACYISDSKEELDFLLDLLPNIRPEVKKALDTLAKEANS